MSWKEMTLAGWGRNPVATVRACRPERRSDAARAVAAQDGTIIPFGRGRSYGDAALNDGGRVLKTERLDRLLDFDDDSGVLVCEPGVTFQDLLRDFVPRGFFAPVSPGTAMASLGGAVANDVHGKNHESAGSFGDHVLWLDIALPSGEIVRASPEERPELFAATIGGVGLTGCIVALAVRLARIPSPRVRLRERRMPDLDTFLATLEEVRRTATFSVGWIDALARGSALGRGILETAEYAEAAAAPIRPRRAIRVPVDLPPALMNRYSIGLVNHFYYRRVPATGRERTVPMDSFLYPLDSLLDWNRLYGRPGFHQFQCVLPDAESPKGIRALLETIVEAGGASFLAVLKTLGGEGRGHLSFPLKGYTLALDFPFRAGTAELLARLERLTLEHGGRVYLAKDATLSPEGFRRMYPKLDRFRAVLGEVDPQRRMSSDLARRLGIHGAP